MQPMLRPRSKTTRNVLPPHAPTCAVLCPFPPPSPCTRFTIAAVVVASPTLPSVWRRMLDRFLRMSIAGKLIRVRKERYIANGRFFGIFSVIDYDKFYGGIDCILEEIKNIYITNVEGFSD
uniref:Uncharacterized protein n=1 Tax=Romanomermis culicivorax TaxID=13658 RepID=A0A915K262_ROMCU